MKSYSCGILGCTGVVGQRFISLLFQHPIMTITSLGASERSIGKKYSQVVNWHLETSIPDSVSSIVVQPCYPDNFQDCDIIFSGLDSKVAGEIETLFADSGFAVFSNSKNHRMQKQVPLLIPLANSDHLSIIKTQKKLFSRKGFIVTNSNCATVNVAVPLLALEQKFGKVSKVNVVTLQAISGAGYPGLASIDIFDNVIPFISDEEEKIKNEIAKILGSINNHEIISRKDLKVSASCNRVNVMDGHMACISVEFKNSNPNIEQVLDCFNNYKCEAQDLDCFSCPNQAIYVFAYPNDRPQPRLDRLINNGFSIVIGRIQKDCNFHVKFVSLTHNTIIGASGSSILNAELAIKKGLI